MSAINIKLHNLKIFIFGLPLCILLFAFCICATHAQSQDLEFTVDAGAQTIPLPPIFKPNIDVSGRGFHEQATWPQGMASAEALRAWSELIGFKGMHRLQYNLWEISQLEKSKDLQDRLINNYESVIKKVTDAGGIVVVSFFGTPANMGRVLDSKSPPHPRDFKRFKELVKTHMRRLSCEKKYNVWYEVWTAPDLDAFFLGRKQDYLKIYRMVAECARELELETKIHIPVGGPGASWWFQNVNGNNIVIPEHSLIYDLIRFCYRYRLPLDFITWHGYSSDAKAEKENTIYKKISATLIRQWLSFFNFENTIPLIVDEWNFDLGSNVLLERSDAAHVSASYIPARLKHMHAAGIDHHIFYCLEDFQNNKEGVIRNVGAFWFDAKSDKYRGGPKVLMNAFRMLNSLEPRLILAPAKADDEFVGALATAGKDRLVMIVYNYVDPDIFRNYLSRNIGTLTRTSRRILLGLIRSGRLEQIRRKEIDLKRVRVNKKLKALFKTALELNDQATVYKNSPRKVTLTIKNLKDAYVVEQFIIDDSCARDCDFLPKKTSQIAGLTQYQEKLVLNPYSVHMIVLRKQLKPEPQLQSADQETTSAVPPTAIEPSQTPEKQELP
ncbi:MAG: hypothetical protein KBA46_02360 [Candidatus Omnitrophica bacterium]|nr:hypothetical protein [Candidatus Omnitrophota bacterium]